MLETIPIWLLEPFESERDHPHYLALRDSIAGAGLVNPPIVRKLDNELYQVVNGVWRVIAARANGMLRIPVIVRQLTDDEVGLLKMDVGTEKRLTEAERAHMCKRLRDRDGYTVHQIAQITHLPPARVRRLLK